MTVPLDFLSLFLLRPELGLQVGNLITSHYFLCMFTKIITLHFSTVTPMDYGAVSTTVLMFNMCQKRSCADVPIVDDLVLENDESFSVTLDRTTGLDVRITLDLVEGEIEITDNDGGYEMIRTAKYHIILLIYSGRGRSGEGVLPGL